MNVSIITKQPEYDYRFISYLAKEIFSKQILAQSSVYKTTGKTHKFLALDAERYSFIERIFNERTNGNKNRMQALSTHMQKICTIARKQGLFSFKLIQKRYGQP